MMNFDNVGEVQDQKRIEDYSYNRKVYDLEILVLSRWVSECGQYRIEKIRWKLHHPKFSVYTLFQASYIGGNKYRPSTLGRWLWGDRTFRKAVNNCVKDERKRFLKVI